MTVLYDIAESEDRNYILSIDFAQSRTPREYPAALFILPFCPRGNIDFDKMVKRAGKLTETWGLFRTHIRFAAGLRTNSWSGIRALEQEGIDIVGTAPGLIVPGILGLPKGSWVVRAYAGVPMATWKPITEADKSVKYALDKRDALALASCKTTIRMFADTKTCDYILEG